MSPSPLSQRLAPPPGVRSRLGSFGLLGVALVLLPALIGSSGRAQVTRLAPDDGDVRQQDEVRQAVTERLRQRLEAAGLPARTEVGGVPLHSTQALPSFYEKRLYRPAWRTGSPALGELIAVLRQARRHGLDPSVYRPKDILRLVSELTGVPSAGSTTSGATVRRSVDLDLLATDAFLTYATHLVAGRVHPETFDPEWLAVRREVDLEAALAEAVDTGQVRRVLEGLLPRQAGYEWLRRALDRYRELARAGSRAGSHGSQPASWPVVPEGETLEQGASGPRVQALAARLAATGDLVPGSGDGGKDLELGEDPAFDETLEAAVRRFQTRHGLEADGKVGPKTLAALNVPAATRVRQIELNLERWRWLPRDLGPRYLLVDIPAFSLELIEGETPVLISRVVAGRPTRRTPVFSDQVRYVVLNPAWEVPHKLAVEDKLPEIRRDPEYFAKMGIHVYEGWGESQREIDPTSVDWATMNRAGFRYRLRQDPGPLNALGRVKIMFPNKHNVYLHDTPSRELFARAERGFSSGCIRVEKALDLASLLLGSAWDRATLDKALAAGTERMVPLPNPVPVHLLYWTASAEEDGTVYFRPDVYDRDRLLDAGLIEVSTASAKTEPATGRGPETP